MKPILTEQFDYHLPRRLLAQSPPARRGGSRLLWRDSDGDFCIGGFAAALRRRLKPGDLLVVNDTKVLPARIAARKSGGGKVEIMLERVLACDRAKVQLRANKSIRTGETLSFGGASCAVVARDARFFIIECAQHDMRELFNRHGQTPLPPYIKRAPTAADARRYQSVYAKHPGAVAAPTAGLHFSAPLIKQLRDAGVGWGALTLHIGAGTFTPVNTAHIDAHTMHAESVNIDTALVAQVARARELGGRVVAVGTSVARALETAALDGELKTFAGDTDLFIRPGFQFRAVDMLLTNFHLPKSTLLMMVAAFTGFDCVMRYYSHAIKNNLRFYSYGDAMLATRQNPRA